MRKIYFLMAMMVLALGIPAWAQESVQSYVESFDNLDTSDHEFAPKGWGHIVDSYYNYGDYEYVAYTSHASGGYDGGAYLSVDAQSLGWYGEDVNDMLVTPPVSGNVSLYVKLEKESGSITFYNCTKDGNDFTEGEVYAVEVPELSMDTWTQVTIPSVPEGTYLGIRGEYVGIDNFQADNAVITLKRELTIVSAELVGDDEIDADENGKASFTYSVTLENTGEVDFYPGDEGYSISIVNRDTPDVALATKNLDFALAAGETSQPVEITATIDVSATIDVGSDELRGSWLAKENITGTTEYVTWITIYPYKVVFSIRQEDSYDDLEPGTELQFGLSQQAVTKNFTMRNDGAASANIDVTVPEGFSVKVTAEEGSEEALTLPAEMPAHGTLYLSVTMTADQPGAKSGDMVIKINGYDNIVFPVSGQIVDPTKLYVNFEDNRFPAGVYLEGDTWSISNFPSSVDLEGNRYCAQNGRTDMVKLVLPKVHVSTGETMVFSAAQRTSSSVLKVYYSADRADWTLVREITSGAENEDDSFSTEKVGYSSSNDNYAFKQFIIHNIPAGDWYIAFESGYARLDDIMGYTLLDIPAVDFVVTESEIPAEGMVNYESKASIGLYNVGSVAVEEGALTAKVYLDGNAVAEQTLPAMETGETASVDIAFTPRYAGNVAVRITVENQGTVVVEQSGEMTVASETPAAEYSFGTYVNTSSNVPLSLNYNNSEAETLYTQDVINLPAGTKILSLIYRGYRTSSACTPHLRVWIENTTDGLFESAPSEMHSTDAMTLIYDGDYTFETKGSANNIQDMLVINLEEPFEYAGNNIRIIIESRDDEYGNTSFECDNNVSNASIYRRSDGDISEQSYSISSSLPVVHALVEKELTVLSGTVVSSKGQSVIAGAEIKLVSGNVEYSGVSGDDGSYSIEVYQDNREYAVTAKKEGFFSYENTVSFPEGSTTMDIAMDEATGFRIKEASVPATAMVNYPYTATVTIENGLEKPAGSYTAELYVGGEAVASDQEAVLEANADHTFTFSYTPHAAGTVSVYVELTSDYGTVRTEEAQLIIAEESAESVVQVGEYEVLSGDGGPIHTYNSTSRTEIIYPKEMIGLSEGSKIISLQYKGYHYGKADVIFNTQVWIGNVSGVEFKENDVTGMTQIFDGQIDFTEAMGSTGETAVLIDIPIPDGFVYTGENIRVVIAANDPEKGWISSYFETDESAAGYARQKAKDTYSLEELDNDRYTAWEDIALPVAYFGIIPSRNVSGVVTDAETNEPVEGALVTLRSGEVEYYATTDVTGSYSVDVLQYSLDYEMTVTADGYLDATQPVSFADGDVELDVVLKVDDGSGVDSVGIDGFRAYGGNGCIVVEADAEASVSVYNMLGVLVRRAEVAAGKTRIDGVGAGVYIVNGVKVMVK